MAAVGRTTTRALNSQEMTESIRGLIESLTPIKGRKTIIFFTGGQQFSLDATAQVNAVLDAAKKANVAIYAIAASNNRDRFRENVLRCHRRHRYQSNTVSAGRPEADPTGTGSRLCA